MHITEITQNNKTIAVVTGENVLTDLGSALDLLSEAAFGRGIKRIALDKKSVTEDFFILSTGLAGAVLEKFVQYGVKIAIYGDYSRYTSKPLRDFIRESSKGTSVFFAETEEEAVRRLAEV